MSSFLLRLLCRLRLLLLQLLPSSRRLWKPSSDFHGHACGRLTLLLLMLLLLLLLLLLLPLLLVLMLLVISRQNCWRRHPLVLTAASLSSSHPFIITPSHPLILAPSHPRTLSPYINLPISLSLTFWCNFPSFLYRLIDGHQLHLI
eukprot:gene4642-8594_t